MKASIVARGGMPVEGDGQNRFGTEPKAVLLLHLRSTLPPIFTVGGRGGGPGPPPPSVQLEVGARCLAIAGGAEEAALDP